MFEQYRCARCRRTFCSLVSCDSYRDRATFTIYGGHWPVGGRNIHDTPALTELPVMHVNEVLWKNGVSFGSMLFKHGTK